MDLKASGPLRDYFFIALRLPDVHCVAATTDHTHTHRSRNEQVSKTKPEYSDDEQIECLEETQNRETEMRKYRKYIHTATCC